MTDTLLEYRTGVNPETGEDYRTGSSRGPVIGGTLFRVRLSPLREVSPERLGQCDENRPSVIQPLKHELGHEWRDLELDRHEGRTWCFGERSLPLEALDVRIDKRTKDIIRAGFIVLLDVGKTNGDPGPNNVLHQSYLYPDTRDFSGAMKLRMDVETTAS